MHHKKNYANMLNLFFIIFVFIGLEAVFIFLSGYVRVKGIDMTTLQYRGDISLS